MRELKQSTAVNVIIFMADSTDHITGKTGLTLTVTLSKDGGAFASISPTVTERTSGWYNIALTSAHTDTVGDLVVRATATGADASERALNVVANVEADTYSRIGAPAGASIAADVAGVQSDTDNIQTRLPAALVGGRIDSSVGSNLDKTGYALTTAEEDAIVDKVWDEALTAATHNVASSSGKRLRQLASNITHSGTAQAGTINSITLDAGASATDGIYEEQLIIIDGGTGAGQAHHIFHYDGATRKAWVDDDWKITPDATSTFILVGGSAHDTIAEGLAQAGGANTITLEAGEPAITDLYKDAIVAIISGTGIHQYRTITAYNGTTKVATVDSNWGTQPDATSGYYIYGLGQVAVRVNNDKAGYALSTAGVDAILDDVVEGTLTLRQIMRLSLAALAGKSSGGGTATLLFKGADGTTTRITAAVDADGNRTAVTVNGA